MPAKRPSIVPRREAGGHGRAPLVHHWRYARVTNEAKRVSTTLPPHYVIPAEAGTQVTYPLGIVEFFKRPNPVEM
jgi:hypothetical protein